MGNGPLSGIGDNDPPDFSTLINQLNTPIVPLGPGAVTTGEPEAPETAVAKKSGAALIPGDQYEAVSSEQRTQRRETLFDGFQEVGADGKPDGNLDVVAFAKHLSDKTGEAVSPDQVRAFFGAGADGKVSKSQFMEAHHGGAEGSGDEAKKVGGHHGGGGGGKVSEDTTCSVCGNSPCTCSDIDIEAALQAQQDPTDDPTDDEAAEMAWQIKNQAVRV